MGYITYMTKTTLRPVTSLAQLEHLAATHDDYRALALAAAENLGGTARNLPEAMRWLRINAMETDDEQGVVEEVNFCR